MQSHSKEPDTMQKDNEAVEVIEKKEVPAAKRVGFLYFFSFMEISCGKPNIFEKGTKISIWR
jgi:hypothetical protein